MKKSNTLFRFSNTNNKTRGKKVQIYLILHLNVFEYYYFNHAVNVVGSREESIYIHIFFPFCSNVPGKVGREKVLREDGRGRTAKREEGVRRGVSKSVGAKQEKKREGMG